MGSSWLAHDLMRGTRVALKVLAAGGAALVESFRAEFATLSGLHHPHLAKVHDFGALRPTDGGGVRWFYTADAVDGTTLDAFARGRSWDAVRASVNDAVDALAFLHRLGVRHGDVKPENVLVDRAGRGVVIDLGCSVALDAPADGMVRGTPGFMAPEVLEARAADARADLFALGV